MIEVTYRELCRHVDPATGLRGDYYEEAHKVQLVNVERVDGCWKAVVFRKDTPEILVINAEELDEWGAGY